MIKQHPEMPAPNDVLIVNGITCITLIEHKALMKAYADLIKAQQTVQEEQVAQKVNLTEKVYY